MRYSGGSIYLRQWVKCWRSLDPNLESHDMDELNRRLQLCFGKLGLQEIGIDVHVENLPEYISCLSHKLKFPIHTALKEKIAFYSPF